MCRMTDWMNVLFARPSLCSISQEDSTPAIYLIDDSFLSLWEKCRVIPGGIWQRQSGTLRMNWMHCLVCFYGSIETWGEPMSRGAKNGPRQNKRPDRRTRSANQLHGAILSLLVLYFKETPVSYIIAIRCKTKLQWSHCIVLSLMRTSFLDISFT